MKAPRPAPTSQAYPQNSRRCSTNAGLRQHHDGADRGALGVTKPYVYYYFHNKQEISRRCRGGRPWPFYGHGLLEDDHRPAQVTEGIERLIRATIEHHPVSILSVPRAPGVPARVHRHAKAGQPFLRPPVHPDGGRSEGRHVRFQGNAPDRVGRLQPARFSLPPYRPDGRLSRPPRWCANSLSFPWRVPGLQQARRNL